VVWVAAYKPSELGVKCKGAEFGVLPGGFLGQQGWCLKLGFQGTALSFPVCSSCISLGRWFTLKGSADSVFLNTLM